MKRNKETWEMSLPIYSSQRTELKKELHFVETKTLSVDEIISKTFEYGTK